MSETKHKIRYVTTIIIDDEWSITVINNLGSTPDNSEMEMLHMPCNAKLEIGLDENTHVPVYYCPKCNKKLQVRELLAIYERFFQLNKNIGGAKWV